MEAGKALPFEQLDLEPLLRHEGRDGRAGGPSADHDYIRIRAHRSIIWLDYRPQLPCSAPAGVGMPPPYPVLKNSRSILAARTKSLSVSPLILWRYVMASPPPPARHRSGCTPLASPMRPTQLP